MGVSVRTAISAVVIDSTVIGGIQSSNLNIGSNVMADGASGEVYARHQSLTAQNPSMSFTTTSIAAALAKMTLLGLDIGALAAKLTAYVQSHAEGGTRTAGSTHRKFTISDGIVVPRRISCSHQGDATLSSDVVITYDGSNDPVIIADSTALPAGVTDAERFTIGPVIIEDVTFNEVKSIDIDFGLDVRTEGADSDIWPTFHSVVSVSPIITLRGINSTWFAAASVPLEGLDATHANTTIYLRKRADGGTFTADATAEHIVFTAAGLCVVDDGFSGSGQEPGEVSIVLHCKYDGTNAPITVDTTSVLP